MTQANRKADDS